LEQQLIILAKHEEEVFQLFLSLKVLLIYS